MPAGADFGMGKIFAVAGTLLFLHRAYTGWRAYRHRKARQKAQELRDQPAATKP